MGDGYAPSVFFPFKTFPIHNFFRQTVRPNGIRHPFCPFIRAVSLSHRHTPSAQHPVFQSLQAALPFLHFHREAADGFTAFLSGQPFAQAGTVRYAEQHPLHTGNEFLPASSQTAFFRSHNIFPRCKDIMQHRHRRLRGIDILTNGVSRKSSDIFSTLKTWRICRAILGAALRLQYLPASVKINCLTSKNLQS